jgi:ABC-type transport system substrate-binding protein
MKRRAVLQAATAGGAAVALSGAAADAPASAPGAKKRLHWAFVAAETGFDPAQIVDLYSNYVVALIYESPLQFDCLARPARIIPRTAAALPEVAADFRSFIVRIRPGILFQDHPAFNGRPRELTAADYVYGVKRLADPRWKAPLWTSIEGQKVVGLAQLRQAALAPGGRFDYDRPIDGLRLLDRYAFEVRLAEPSPRFVEFFTDARYWPGIAREVVEAAPDETMARPVGTGPFRLAQWTRSSRILLERNPTFRDEFYAAEPPAQDARAQQVAVKLRGRKLPLIDEIQFDVIEESQPRWLSFLNGEHDTVNVPLEFIQLAAPGGSLAPSLAKRDIELERIVNPDIVYTYFNMDDPLVGGLSPERVALRRAISLAYDTEAEKRDIRRGAFVLANASIPPYTSAFDPDFLSEMNRYDPARAKALLDTYGFVDRNGDGWRESPDGSQLVLRMATQGSQIDRQFNELWKRSMNAVGLNMQFDVGQWPEQFKQARAGKLMMWTLGGTATVMDADDFVRIGHSANIPGSNYARYRNPAYDRLYERQRPLPDGPERMALFREMQRILLAHMPYKVHGHRILNDVSHPWLIGYRRHPFAHDFGKWIDLDVGLRAKLKG